MEREGLLEDWCGVLVNVFWASVDDPCSSFVHRRDRKQPLASFVAMHERRDVGDAETRACRYLVQ